MHKIDGAVKWYIKTLHLQTPELREKLESIANEFELHDVDELLAREILKQYEAKKATTAAAAAAGAGASDDAPAEAVQAAARAQDGDVSDNDSESDAEEMKSERGALKTIALMCMVLGKHMDIPRAVYKQVCEVHKLARRPCCRTSFLRLLLAQVWPGQESCTLRSYGHMTAQEWDITHLDKPHIPFGQKGAAASRKMDAAGAVARDALEAMMDRRVPAAFFDEQAQLDKLTNIALNVRSACDDLPTMLHMLTIAIVWDVFAQPGVALSSHTHYADVVGLLQIASDMLHDFKNGEVGALRSTCLRRWTHPPTENGRGAFGPRKRIRSDKPDAPGTPESPWQRCRTASGLADAGAIRDGTSGCKRIMLLVAANVLGCRSSRTLCGRINRLTRSEA